MSDAENLTASSPTPSKSAETLFATPSTSKSSASTADSAFSLASRSQSPRALLNRTNSAHASARRALFFERGRKARDDKRYEGRSEQAMRLEFLREKREWEERIRRAAAAQEISDMDLLEDEMADVAEQEPILPEEDINPQEYAEWIMSQGEMEQDVQTGPGGPLGWSEARQQHQETSQQEINKGYRSESDDDEYDELFMDVLSKEPAFDTGEQSKDVEMS